MKKLKEKLSAKLSKNGGFTLIEMLIVVAIIAILVAVSIPLVNNALDRAKHATDAANERSAKAEILICYLSDEATMPGGGVFDKALTYCYDAVDGALKAPATTINGYGKHGKHDGQVLYVRLGTNDEVEMLWDKAAATAPTTGYESGFCSANDVDEANHK